MGNPLSNGIEVLRDFGFFDVFLPLLLIFFIFYAILTKTKILGDPEKGFVRGINAIVSAIVAFIFITQTRMIEIMNTVLPRSALLLVITMLVLVLLSFVGVYKTDVFEGKWWGIFIAIPLILIFLGLLDVSGLYIPGIHQVIVAVMGGGGVKVTQETINIGIAVMVCAAVMGLIAWVIVKGGD